MLARNFIVGMTFTFDTITDVKEIDCVWRQTLCAKIKRNIVIAQIRAVHAMALRVSGEKGMVSDFLILAADLDALWTQFKSDVDSVLDHLVALNRVDEYSVDLAAELRGIIIASQVVAANVTPTGEGVGDRFDRKDRVKLADLQHRPPTHVTRSDSNKPPWRLPEIPLSQFEGDGCDWTTFRDRFLSLVDGRPKLSDLDRMCYLLGCLKGPAADAVWGIPLSGENYQLVWSTLSNRYNRPRPVATSLVDTSLPAASVPSVRDVLCRQTPVEDICYGADTVANVVTVHIQGLDLALPRSGPEPRTWSSNTPTVLEVVPAEHLVLISLSVADDDNVGTKILEIPGHLRDDYFCCKNSLDASPILYVAVPDALFIVPISRHCAPA